MIERSWNFSNPEFTITFNGQELTKVRFDTYMNNEKCQGWAFVSNVYEDSILVQKTENRFYLLGNK
ncbi:hypothetical protein [Dyadobacter sediminis]|uniref:hypothetical protein n=1 Tax=Dyadobacter sediminis TaxID=1493691 RepID=UPI001664FBAE|nr:hypothetical protein [Dyadobacter sediminis]GGB78771.1 hypothetical protein GCM10011325_02890 [Dyadobacter sediminis]